MKRRLYLLVAGTFLGLVIAEIAIRFIIQPALNPDEYRQRYVEYQASVFARNNFPERAQKSFNDSSGTSASINSLGYRGREFFREKPENTFRIVLFGGSFTFDIYNNNDSTWAEILEKQLSSRAKGTMEVINAGIPGHSATDAVGRLFSEIHTLKPDMVVLPIGWNDIKDLNNSQPLIRYRSVYSGKNDPYRFYQNNLDWFLSRYSQSYLHIRTAYYHIKLNPGVEGRQAGETGQEDVALPAVQQLNITLKTFSDIAKNIGSIPVFVLEPTLVTRNGSLDDRKHIGYGYTPFSHNGLLNAYNTIEREVRQSAKDNNTELIDLRHQMNGNKAYFYDHVHLTKEGSSVFAELICTELLPLIPK